MGRGATIGPKGIDTMAAVWDALDELGDKTSMPVLIERASQIYGSDLSYHSVCGWRKQYRQAKDLSTDCRTYGGQPRRNMLSDTKITAQQKTRIKTFLRAPSKTKLRNLAEQFHSVPQFINAILATAGAQQLQAA